MGLGMTNNALPTKTASHIEFYHFNRPHGTIYTLKNIKAVTSDGLNKGDILYCYMGLSNNDYQHLLNTSRSKHLCCGLACNIYYSHARNSIMIDMPITFQQKAFMYCI